LKKDIGIPSSAAKKHYYCPVANCNGPLTEQLTCCVCLTHSTKKVLEKKDAFFYLYDVATEIRECLEIPEVGGNVLSTCTRRNVRQIQNTLSLTDIIDGSEYRKLGNSFNHV